MRNPTPKTHNKIPSGFQSAPPVPHGATPRPSAGAAQEAVVPSPGSHPTPDACGSLPQKKPRIPVPVKGRSRRGRPYPQNRDGSGNSGIAEGSLPRLAPRGQDIEQEIILLRSLANRLLSRRPVNYSRLFNCLNLIARFTTVKARFFNTENDDRPARIAAGMKKLLDTLLVDGSITYRDLLPALLSRPGEEWPDYQDLLPIHPDLMHSLLYVKDAWEREHGSPFIDNPSHDEEIPPHPEIPPLPPPDPGPLPPAPAQPDLYPQDPYSSFTPVGTTDPYSGELDPFPYHAAQADPNPPFAPGAPRIARGHPPDPKVFPP